MVSKLGEFFKESEEFLGNVVKLLSKHEIETELKFDNMVLTAGKIKINLDGKTMVRFSPKEKGKK